MEAREVGERCGGCKCMEKELYWNHHKFIRFRVAFCFDFHQKRPIPEKIAENIRPNFINPKLTLRVPSGVSWEVYRLISVDGFFLQHGWEEFVNAHSLQENDHLLFEYDRDSTFNVMIFDGEYEKVSAYYVKKCEHVNPIVENHMKRVVHEVVGDEDNESCIVAKKSRKEAGAQQDGPSYCTRNSKKSLSLRNPVQSARNNIRKKVAERSSVEKQGRTSQAKTGPVKQTEQNGQANKEVPCADEDPLEVSGNTLAISPPKKVAAPETRPRTRRSLRSNSTVSITAEAELARQSPQRKSLGPKITVSPAVKYVSNRRPVTNQERTEAMAKAASGLSENSFFSAMQYHNCYKGFFMEIPSRFASNHLGYTTQEVILRVGEKLWTTKFTYDNSRLGTGWKEFALDNYLEEYDVCLFKLVSQENGGSVTFEVTIFRVVDVVNPPTILTA